MAGESISTVIIEPGGCGLQTKAVAWKTLVLSYGWRNCRPLSAGLNPAPLSIPASWVPSPTTELNKGYTYKQRIYILCTRYVAAATHSRSHPQPPPHACTATSPPGGGRNRSLGARPFLFARLCQARGSGAETT